MDLPAEIVANILSRIPIIKTIVHCRCVCKTWCNILSEPYFVDLHLLKSPGRLLIHQSYPPQPDVFQRDIPHLLHLFPPNEPDFLKVGELVDKTGHHDIHYDPVMRFDLGLGFKSNVVFLIGTVNGLVCLWNHFSRVPFYICNPITRESILLPDNKYDLKFHTTASHGFGFVKASNEYKVVSLYIDRDYTSECKIYTLGTGTWRSLGHLPFSVLVGGQPGSGTFFSGNLHWFTNGQDTTNKMVCTFDLEKELFHLTAAPPLGHGKANYSLGFGVLGGCLCICVNTPNSEIAIWVMKNYGMKESWIKEIVIRHNPKDIPALPLRHSTIVPLKILEDGSILMVSFNRFLFIYHPEHETLQIFEGGYADAFHAMEYVPSFIRLESFTSLEKD